jgi:chemotaxis protein histidine kinase CheA/CheY-like chemotaxis protein
MQSEQQQRIMGYFIEEAKDHLNTIEQGLLNLQTTMEDREMLNEVFRAAHSVKGGAAMLGIHSIQHTAHRLEDCFKTLQESPVQVDHQLEALFLRVFDTLQALIEHLQSPFGLSEETTSNIMSDAEPVFAELNAHLEKLVEQAEGASVATTPMSTVALVEPQLNTGTIKTVPPTFKRDVLVELREMLHLFKQDDSTEHREALQGHCRQLRRLGEPLDLPGWSELMETARAAIASPSNSYRLLANVVIKEIKQAQELIVAGRSAEICPSEQLRILVPEPPVSIGDSAWDNPELAIDLSSDYDFGSDALEFEAQSDNNALQDESEVSAAYLFDLSDRDSQVEFREETNPQGFTPDNLTELSSPPTSSPPKRKRRKPTSQFTGSSEPEVGMAELNTLADIFEGQTPDLDETWQEEEIINLDDLQPGADTNDTFSLNDSSEFSDLVGELDESEGLSRASTEASSGDDLMDLFGDDPSDEWGFGDSEALLLSADREPAAFSTSTPNSEPLSTTTDEITDDFSDLLFETESPNSLGAASTSSDDLTSLFGDSFFEEDASWEQNLDDFEDEGASPAHAGLSELQQQDEEIFGVPVTDVFDDAPLVFSTDADTSTEGKDGFSQHFTTEEDEFLTFDDSLLTLEGMGSDENWLEARDADDTVPEIPQEQGVSEVQAVDDERLDLSFDELGWDEPTTGLDFETTTNLTGSEAAENITAWAERHPSPGTELSLEESFFDTFSEDGGETQSSLDVELEDLAPIEESSAAELWNWDAGSESSLDESAFNRHEELTQAQAAAAQMPDEVIKLDSPAVEEDLSFLTQAANEESLSSWDEPELVLNDFIIEGTDGADEGSDLDFDLDAISLNPSNLEEPTSEAMDSLFEHEALSSSEASLSATLDDLETLNDWLDPSTTEPALTVSESLLATDAQSEGLDLFALEQLATSSDFDGLGDSTETEIQEVASDSTLDFEEFSLFDTPTEVDSAALDSSQASTHLEDAFELLVESSPTSEEPVADLSGSLFDTSDTDERIFLELEAAAAHLTDESGRTVDDAPASDLEALFGDETPPSTDTFDLSSFGTDDLNLDAELFADDSSSSGWEFAAQEAAEESQAPMFDWEETETPPIETTAQVESSPVSDWEGLLADSDSSLEENFFETDLATPEAQTSDEAAATVDFLDWGGTDAIESDELESFLRADAAEVADTSDLDIMLLHPEQEGATASDTAQLLDAWDFDEADDAAVVFDLEGATESNGQMADAPEELAVSSLHTSEFDDLEAMLDMGVGTETPQELEAMNSLTSQAQTVDEFADLEAMLEEGTGIPVTPQSESFDDVFEGLAEFLEEQAPSTRLTSTPAKPASAKASAKENEFADLDELLEQAQKEIRSPATTRFDQGMSRSPIRRPAIDQTMRVPVKHLDSLSNLVGELVVNRNTLEQDQERLRQFLDNLSHQVLALSDVGARMQDLYERSLLESSLLASRQGYRHSFHAEARGDNRHTSGVEYDPLEMDRFTGFHLLSQEMIELIVRVRESASDIEFLVDETDQVARMLRQITTQLQEGLTRARMVPFAQNADRLLRAVHEISRKLGKEAQLHIEGRETLIDKMILERLYDPMTHLVNNALTHGIESPEIRKAAGKPSVGKVILKAFHQGNQTLISISDDGAGIDPERVRAKAIEQKLISPAEAKTLTNIELYDFLFHPGFSTKDKADDFAGRGVGMDVVRTSLSECRGTIQIDSAVGKGTTFTIRLPLTLSICKALCCLSDRASIAFPMDGVEDMMDVVSDRLQTNAEGQTCIQWRDSLLLVHPLSELLTFKRQLSRNAVYGGKREDDMISIVVLRSAGNFLAIQVDRVLGEQEIVIKQLEGPPPKPVGIAGATVLGDGRIMAIADVLELIDLANGRIRKDSAVSAWSKEDIQSIIPQETPEVKTEPMVLIVDDSITVRELLSMTFNKAGYRVEQARDGQEAWEKLRSGLPCDIIFCDIEMPRMDGLELLSRLQKDENLAHLPIAMLTSRGAEKHRQMASQLGASGYFTKPYLEEVLLDAAQRMIKGEVLFGSNSNA